MNGRREGSVAFEGVDSGTSRRPASEPEIEWTESVQRRFARLSAREREVMRLVASGLLNKQIAFKLGISVPTVKFHRNAVMRKMKADSLASLVWMAAALDAPAQQRGNHAEVPDQERSGLGGRFARSR